MLVKNLRGWELSESAATPESAFLDRRSLLKGVAAGSILAMGTPLTGVANAAEGDPSAHLYPVERNGTYTIERELTPERTVTTYNNFYEFGSSKDIWRAAQNLPLRPWQVRSDGMVEQ